jgi:dihydrofolate reductase
MSVRLLVAAAENDVIGRGGRLPWRLPADLRRFASLTRGHAVVMGRATYESVVASVGGPLPGRHSVVVSGRGLDVHPEGVETAASPQDAAARAERFGREHNVEDWFVIGGASIYRQLLDQVDLIDLTRVHADVDGDARMPPGWLDGFVVAGAETATDEAAGLSYSYLRLTRAGRR